MFEKYENNEGGNISDEKLLLLFQKYEINTILSKEKKYTITDTTPETLQKIIEYTYYHFRKKFFGENGKKEIDIQEITNMIEQIITMKKKLLTMQDQIEQSAYINNHFPETISRFFEKNIQDLCLIEIIDTYNDILIPYFYYFHNIFNGRSDEEISLFFKYETIEGKEESIKELLRETDSLQTQKEIIDIFRAFDEEHQK